MKKFKTESRKIMNLMINSIYTNKDIFLRELISNASDAIEKCYYESIKSGESGLTRNDFNILIETDSEKRTLTISDNGIGMNKESLENNLGTIAKSGSEEFMKLLKEKDEFSLIGHFGVGFYSAFMVSKKIEVVSKAYKEEDAYKWESEGEEGYEITQTTKDSNGTTITLYLKDNTEDEDYDVYLEDYKIRSLIKKYSDFIRFPIKLKTKNEENNLQVLNSQVPIWRKNKSELKEEDYFNFYKDMFGTNEEPLTYLHLNIEGKLNFRALLFIPKSIPYGYYSKEFEKGLKLYTNGVMITEKCSELLPDYLNFVKGVVDGELQLNISRETLQESRELKAIASSIEDKIKNELIRLQKDENEKYVEFFKAFGLQIKYSLYKEWGMNKDKLQDLLMYHSVINDKFISLKEYFNSMKDNQKYIYYSCGASIEGAKNLVQVENITDNGYDVLCMNEEIDEFTIKFLRDYQNKEFTNVLSDNLGIYNDEEDLTNDNQELVNMLSEILKEKVERVKLSKNLKNHPISLSSEGEISLEMERTLNANPNNHEKISAKKILEINKNHSIYNKIETLYNENKMEELKDTMSVLFDLGKLISGLQIEKPNDFAQKLSKLIS